MREVGRNALLGSMTTVGGSLAAFAVRFAVNAHLARVLLPEAFGVYAQASVYAAIVAILGAVSFPQALVQLPDDVDAGDLAATVRRLTAWSSALLGVVALAAWPLVELAPGPDVARCFLVLVGVNALGTYGSTFELELQRHHRWHIAAGLKLGANLVAVAFVVPLAHLTRDPLVLVLRDALAPVLVMLAVVVARWKSGVPRGRYDRAIAARVWVLGRALFVNRALEIVLHKVDSALVGELLGQRALGLYDQARYLAALPNAALGPVTQTVGLRLMASLQGDGARLGRAFALLQWGVTRAILVFALGCLVAPELAVRVVFGPAWLDAAPILQALSIWCALFPLSGLHVVFLMARADWRPIRAGYLAALVALAVALPPLALALDAVGVAIAHTIAIGVELVVRVRGSSPHLGARARDHAINFAPLVLALALGVAGGRGFGSLLDPGYEAQALALVAGLAVAAATLVALEGRRTLAELRYLRDILRRPAPRPPEARP